jgi:methyltransferase FkbM-like protein
MLKALKRSLLPVGEQPIRVRAGLYRGLELIIEPQDSAQLLFGLQERETHRYIRRMLRRARWMIDIGAAHGELALLFARNRIRSTAIDADDHGRLARHAAMNGIPIGLDLEVHGKFVGTAAADNIVTLDTLTRDRADVGFVKIDVDGGEIDVIESGRMLLAEKRTNFLIETHSSALEKGCIDLLSAAGYTVSIIDNAWWRRFVPEQRPIEHNRWLTAEPR